MEIKTSQNKTVVAIVTWNNAGEIAECLESLQKLPANWEVWVADNCSADRTTAIVKKQFPGVNLLENKENLGFAGGCNEIVRNSTSEFILFLNPDTIVSTTNLEKSLEEIIKKPKIGVLTVKMFDEDNVLQKTCYKFPTLFNSLFEKTPLQKFLTAGLKTDILLGDYFDHQTSREIDWMYGAFMLARRTTIEKVGGIPEDYFLFAEDLDFCYQIARAGYKNWFFADAEIVHKSNKSAGQLPTEWRIERTVMSKYAFCFKNFGLVRTRLIQIIDLCGNLSDVLFLRIKGENSVFINELKAYRKVILKALKLNRAETLELLNRRPAVDLNFFESNMKD